MIPPDSSYINSGMKIRSLSWYPTDISDSITKCNSVTDQSNGMEDDPGLLSEIAESSIVTKHAMKTEQFPFERTWVPGFMGFLDIRLTGEEMAKQYVRFLLRFGEYSGVGIKTGMGAMCVSFDGKCGSRDECNGSETI